MILKDLGQQTPGDLSFLTSKHAMTYIKELEGSIGYHKGKKKEAPIVSRSAKMAD